jgi:hypothetical protein
MGMGRIFVITLGVLGAVGLIVLGLGAWHRADTLVRWLGWKKRHMAYTAVQCSAVGFLALAQAVLLWLVTDRVYRRDLLCDLLKLSAVLVGAVCAACAAALGVAGR